MAIEVKIPEMEGIESVTVTYWHHKEGEYVEEGKDLVEVATDKATFNIPAPASGKLTKCNFPEGETVKTGTVIAVLD